MGGTTLGLVVCLASLPQFLTIHSLSSSKCQHTTNSVDTLFPKEYSAGHMDFQLAVTITCGITAEVNATVHSIMGSAGL